ncbi:STAS domain-containing protein [Amycolatopsis sp. NPDC005232]|uniref:STAS domain-containing protein n=1 Tax=Amycolatopsis sp. NPDC005232 TaxID=3157027 RepID=UPI0033B1B47E
MTSSPRDVPETGDLLVTVRRHERAAVVTVAGEIDLVTAPELDEIVTAVVDESPEVLVVDLRKVTFLSSAGLQVLAAAHQRLGERRLRVVSTSHVTTRPLTSTGLDAWIGLFTTVDEALASGTEA